MAHQREGSKAVAANLPRRSGDAEMAVQALRKSIGCGEGPAGRKDLEVGGNPMACKKKKNKRKNAGLGRKRS